jgi:gentisate 1,2-dioxygenase
MEEGDFIVTPQMAWHDHANPTDQPIIWLDALDAPLIQLLEQIIFENYELPTQPITYTSEQIGLLYGSVRPMAELDTAYYHYRWRDVYPVLQTMVQRNYGLHHFDGYVLEYRNPVSGGPTLPTMQCALHLFKPGQKTDCHRHTSTTIYHVFRGSGSTVIENMRFDWETGDSFVVPLWHAHYHLNRSSIEDAILFSLSDAPVLRALNLYHEAPCTT